MTQSAGLLVADTKLDLAVAPAEFLARAAHLWDPQGAFGQLQNQAYGYLWPMGPFFLLGDALGLPGWVVQRLWVAMVMCVATVGAALLARTLGVRSDLAAITAGFAYALSPRMLTVLGPISIEAWPSAVAPWVLIPLVVGATRGSPRRAAALAGLAVATVGGVNAAATFAVIPLGGVWLLTRERGPRRRQLMVWWPIATLLGTLWWLVPLFLMGAYSPPFLDYIESAPITTFPTTVFDALRGTSNWIPFIDADSRAGNDLITQPYLVLNSVVLMVAGLLGLALPRNRHKTFLWSGIAVGLVLVTMGHLGTVQGWFAQPMNDWLDGAFSPLRNVHKFDTVIRLPMVIGLAYVVEEMRSRRRRTRSAGAEVLTGANRRILAGTLVLAVVGASAPVALGRLTPSGGFGEIPQYWSEAATFLEQTQDSGVALLVPGSSFGTYVWGTPRDEPLQALAGAPWAIRNAVPLTPTGNIRMLDEVEKRLNEGDGGDGLTDYLRRAGVSHLVVRNDLVRSSDIPDPVLVHQALDSSPGLTRVASFGPEVGGDAEIDGEIGKAVINSGWQTRSPAVEVYEVSEPSTFTVVAPSRPVTVVGGPEDLVDLADLGVVSDAPVRLATDIGDGEPDGPVVLTDGLRSVERSFGRIHDATSEVLGADTPRRSVARFPDYELEDSASWKTRSAVAGIEGVTASVSQSDVDAGGAIEPADMPYAAVDGFVGSAWRSARTEDPAWWRVDFGTPRELGKVTITVGDRSDEVLTVSAGEWSSGTVRVAAGETVTLAVPGRASHLRVDDISERPFHQTVLAEVDLGMDVRRDLVVPSLPPTWGVPDAVVLRRLVDARTGCATVDGDVRCSPQKESGEEEPRGFSRVVTLPDAVSRSARIEVSSIAGPELDELLLRNQPVGITASSSGVRDVRVGALAAIDGDVGTTWVAGPDEVNPQLRLRWLGEQRITGVALDVARQVAAREPLSLELTWPGGSRTVELESGRASFPAIRTTQLTLEVGEAEAATDLTFDGAATPVPVGITELRLVGLPYLPLRLPATARDSGCGVGPSLRINSRTYRTRVTIDPLSLAGGGAVEAELCGTGAVDLQAGRNEIEMGASSTFAPDSLVLGGTDAESVAPARTTMADDASRSVELDDGDAVVATRENANAGWDGARDGQLARSVPFDGWRQGWDAPGAGSLRTHFAPDTTYRAALGLGLLTLLLLLVVAAWPPRAGARRHRPVAGRRPGAGASVPAVVVTSGVLAGWPGAAAAALGVLLAVAGRRLLREAAPLVLTAPLVVSGMAYVVRPWGSSEGWAGELAWPQLCCVVALSGVCALAALEVPPRRRRSPRRMKGLSTKR
jgi:arabinofuranan 3-O-arabinosyltransferase